MPIWLILLATGAYMGLLFTLAWRGDAKAEAMNRPVRPWVYVLALAVYCTSWTFYGAVGTAASSGWDYLPIYLGPALVFLFLPGLIARIGDIAQRESITSISDLLAARYGKSRTLGAVATLAAVIGSLPYIALQLKSVGMSFQVLAGEDPAATTQPAAGTVFLTALALALFAILFGARQADATRRNAGLMQVLAFESAFKLIALGAVALLSLSLIDGADPARLAEARVQFDMGGPVGGFLTLTLLSMAAIICLPRQFHVAVIERGRRSDVYLARWLFPLYLALTSIVVIPITLAGIGVLGAGASPDVYVLALPISEQNWGLALLVFLGGFSAATGMVIVASVALSTMVTHDLIIPAMMRLGRFSGAASGRAAGQLVGARRITIFALLLLAYGYYLGAGSSGALAQIGLLSFAAAIQFAPALLAGIYWRTGHRNGAIGGIVLGMAAWVYTLLAPALVGHDQMVAAGLSGALDPQALLGADFGDPLTHGVVWSLGLNTLAFIVLSLRARVRLRDRIQAAVFTTAERDAGTDQRPAATQTMGATPNGLKALAARFLAPEAVDHAFASFERETGLSASGDEPADWRLVQRTERLLASALGASSARVVMASALAGSAVALGDVLSILDHQTQAARFDRHMLQSMLENISQGISVVDHQQKLVAWNSAYVDLFRYPRELISVGRPVADLIRHNIERGWIAANDPEDEIHRRVAHIRAGAAHSFERQNPDGTWLRIQGSPMPGGGYLTTFTDISEDKAREQALIELNESLEARVTARTEDLRAMASDLDSARQEAERANASKTSFLAAASHDLLQPLNAARLFLGTLAEREGEAAKSALIAKSDRAIASADQLLRGLLDISRLDQGDVEAKPVVLPAGPLLEDLVDEASPMAREAGLEITLAPTSLMARADPDFLQSILRNFLSNARRYTKAGRILVGARRRGGKVRFEVWDTGPGIPPERLDVIFEAFQRFEEADNRGVRGAGLGLAIASRLAGIMGAEVGVRSEVGRGSVFFLEVDRAVAERRSPKAVDDTDSGAEAVDFAGVRVLCVDDEPAILEAMGSLLGTWGCEVALARNAHEAVRAFDHLGPDVVFVDYQLAGGETGLDVVDRLRIRARGGLAAALLTADQSETVRLEARRREMDMLAKPVEPGRLRETLGRLVRAPSQAAE